MTAIDLTRLPPPAVVETLEFEAVRARLAADLAARSEAGEVVRDSDPAGQVLTVAAYESILLRGRVNDAALAVMLPTATGADLENLVALAGLVREVIDPGDPETEPPVPPALESDDRLRRRFLERWSELAAAGPSGAYRSLALGASPDVMDVAAVSPEPCEVELHVLARDGVPDADLLALVAGAADDRDSRPMGDRVTVLPATVTDYAVTAHLTIAKGPDAEVVAEAARAAVEAHTAWSEALGRTPLGRSITLAGLIARLAPEGVVDVVLAEPAASIVCAETEAARCTGVTVTWAVAA